MLGRILQADLQRRQRHRHQDETGHVDRAAWVYSPASRVRKAGGDPGRDNAGQDH